MLSNSSQILSKWWAIFRHSTYLTSPYESMFETAAEVPNYYAIVSPLVITLLVAEAVVLCCLRRDAYSLRESAMTLMLHFASETIKRLLLVNETASACYDYVHAHYRLVDLPWHSPLTWVACLLANDLAYYCMHAMLHKVPLLWAVHKSHHSAEHFAFVTNYRHGLLNPLLYAAWTAGTMSFFFPRPVAMVHMQLHGIRDIWVHTDLYSLKWLDWLFVTPSLHKVHHGRNAYCLDKNFGSMFSVWDRLFGTLQREVGQVHYGTVAKERSSDPIWTEATSLASTLRAALLAPGGVRNKLRCLLVETAPGGAERSGDKPTDDQSVLRAETAKRIQWPASAGLVKLVGGNRRRGAVLIQRALACYGTIQIALLALLWTSARTARLIGHEKTIYPLLLLSLMVTINACFDQRIHHICIMESLRSTLVLVLYNSHVGKGAFLRLFRMAPLAINVILIYAAIALFMCVIGISWLFRIWYSGSSVSFKKHK